MLSLLLGGAFVVRAHGSAQAADAGLTTSSRNMVEGYHRYVWGLERLAKDYEGFGYLDANAKHVVRIGFVGRVPKQVRQRLAEAPDGVTVRQRPSLYTHRELRRAVNRAISNDTYSLAQAGPMSYGRGIEVWTDSRELLRSHDPRGLLGVDVGVFVLRGSSTADVASAPVARVKAPVTWQDVLEALRPR